MGRGLRVDVSLNGSECDGVCVGVGSEGDECDTYVWVGLGLGRSGWVNVTLDRC